MAHDSFGDALYEAVRNAGVPVQREVAHLFTRGMRPADQRRAFAGLPDRAGRFLVPDCVVTFSRLSGDRGAPLLLELKRMMRHVPRVTPQRYSTPVEDPIAVAKPAGYNVDARRCVPAAPEAPAAATGLTLFVQSWPSGRSRASPSAP